MKEQLSSLLEQMEFHCNRNAKRFVNLFYEGCRKTYYTRPENTEEIRRIFEAGQ